MEPKFAESAEGVFRCETAPQLLMGQSLLEAGPQACLPLEARLEKGTDQAVKPAAPNGALPKTPFLLVGLVSDHAALQALATRVGPRLPAGSLGDEGYAIEVTPAHVLIAAEKPAGAFYGVCALLERALPAKGLKLRAETLADRPAMRWRGMHVSISSRASLSAAEELLTRFAPRYRINQVILEINYHFRFRSHPEVAEPDSLTVEDCRRLREVADRSFVRLVPMINCLGHQSWSKTTLQFLKVHPEFDETPALPADNPGIYCRSWCPSHPDVNRVVFDLMDELIDAFRADAFHVGMDEVFLLGECPRCKGQPSSVLFARAVNDYHQHLVGERKVEMMMWGDRLLDAAATGYGEWEAAKNGTAPAVDIIPRDIVLCDWHYGERADYPSVRTLQAKGFRIWPASWKSDRNARLLATCALRHSGERMVGYLSTTWVGVDAVVKGLGGDAEALKANKNLPGVVAATDRGLRIAWEGK